jgi:hypothetical protein
MAEPKVWRRVALVLEIAAVAALLFLVWQNAQLRRTAKLAMRSAAPRFHAGDSLPGLQVIDLTGKPQTLRFQEGRVVVALVDPGCGTCQDVIRSLRSVSSARIISVADLAGTEPLLRGTPNAYVSDPRDPLRGQFGKVPQILLVEQEKVMRTCATARECQ